MTHLWKRYPVTVSYPDLYISLLVEYKKVILSLLQYVINVITNYKQITNLSVGYDLKV